MRHKKNKFLEVLRIFWSRILVLPFGRRLIFFSAIFSILLLFLPWFSASGVYYSGFEKTFLFAALLLILSIFSLLLVLREVFSHVGSLGTFTHSNIFIGIFSQALLVTVLANASLSTVMETIEDSSLSNITLMFVFVSFGVGLAGAFFSRNFMPISQVKKEVFVDTTVDLSHAQVTPENDLSLGEYDQK